MLFAHKRWANADQLYGYSAECGLKLVMESIGMVVDDKGVPAERRHRVHVRELWPEFIAFVGARREGARYVALMPPDVVDETKRKALFRMQYASWFARPETS